MPKRVVLALLIVTVGFVVVERRSEAEGLLQWLSHLDPTPRRDLNSGSDLHDPAAEPAVAPALPPQNVKLQFQIFRSDLNRTEYWTSWGPTNATWVESTSFDQPGKGRVWLLFARNLSEVILHNPNVPNVKILLTRDGSLFTTFNPPPGRSWRFLGQGPIVRE